MRLSIIVPIYNAEKYICRCVDSLLIQGLTDYEVLLIDDGSTDLTPVICDEYSCKHSNIFSYHLSNSGVSNARNFGIEKATGDYLTFVDSDDMILPNTYQKLIRQLESSKKAVDILQYNFAYGKEAPKRKHTKQIRKKKSINGDYAIKKCFFPKKIHNSVCTKLFRASMAKSVHFDSRISIGEDLKYTIDCCLKSDIVLLSDICGYVYYLNDDSAMHQELNNKMFDIFDVNDYAKESCKSKRVYKHILWEDFIRATDMLYTILTEEKCIDRIDFIIDRIRKDRRSFFSPFISIKYKLIAILAIFNIKICKKICFVHKRKHV